MIMSRITWTITMPTIATVTISMMLRWCLILTILMRITCLTQDHWWVLLETWMVEDLPPLLLYNSKQIIMHLTSILVPLKALILINKATINNDIGLENRRISVLKWKKYKYLFGKLNYDGCLLRVNCWFYIWHYFKTLKTKNISLNNEIRIQLTNTIK